MTRIKRYAFINAKLKTRLGKMLGDEFFEKLSRAATLNEAVQLLRDTAFAPVEAVYAETGDLKMGERELFSIEVGLYMEIRKMIDPELQDFLDALLCRYEIENLKEALRLWLDQAVRQRDISAPSGYLFRGELLSSLDYDRIVNAPDIGALMTSLNGTPYVALLVSNADEILSSSSLFSLETDLDRFFYGQLLETASRLDKQDFQIVQRIIGVEIDLENLARLIRFSHYYSLKRDQILPALIPGGLRLSPARLAESPAVSDENTLPALAADAYPDFAAFGRSGGSDPGSRLLLLEELLQQIMNREVGRLLRGNPFTVGTMLAYFILKRREIRRLSTILNAKNYGFNAEETGRHL